MIVVLILIFLVLVLIMVAAARIVEALELMAKLMRHQSRKGQQE